MAHQNCQWRFLVYIGDGTFGLNFGRPIRVATGVCGLCLSCAAVASPPFSWAGPSHSAVVSTRSPSLVGRPIAQRDDVPTTYLDLRPPVVSPSAIRHEATTASAPAPFPYASHHLDLSTSDLAPNDRTQARALGIGELNFNTMSQAETLARRMHQEGLPIARLFGSKSASLSIGLNRKGKPGLWFTRKTH